MHTVLDCRGLACPQPVIRAKELLDSMGQGSVEVLVDNEAAQSNLARFGKSQGCAVAIRAS
ncbi:MAG: sulfurtransferase-like selenium metabolism protein YedF, partial [Deltaproteobacteria bacterium HGW-Deltaproteobacteria-16]